MKTKSLLTDISTLTCSCSTCTCANSFETNNDCLTYVFLILYESSIWSIQIIYELFFKSFWQVLLYIKQEFAHAQYTNKRVDTVKQIPINNSANVNCSKTCKKSKQNRVDKSLTEQKDTTYTVLVPVRSSYCQTEILKNDAQTITLDINQSDKNIHETSLLTNPEIDYKQNQKLKFSNTSFVEPKIHHAVQTVCPQQSFNERKEADLYQPSSLYSVNQNTKLSSQFVSDSTEQDQLASSNLPSRKPSRKPFKSKQRMINDNNIALALSTSLHSNISLYNANFSRTKYKTPYVVDNFL